eukprot:TRINITY_DN2739_c0_g1_i2.p2 TRINITY_DN2739_c0_g1~~TRINITY_DN2739_c0_g1_i2.p2  ORF type:complete len:579 (-),score=204.85 TRINITY_DN2739_c0_g1_i2:113-1849(-)
MKVYTIAILFALALTGASAQADNRGQPAYDPFTPFYHAQAGGLFPHPFIPHPLGPWGASPYNAPSTKGASGPASVGLHYHAPTAYPFTGPYHPYYYGYGVHPAAVAGAVAHNAAFAAAHHAAAAAAHAHAAAVAGAVAHAASWHAAAAAAVHPWGYPYAPYAYPPVAPVPGAPGAGGDAGTGSEAPPADDAATQTALQTGKSTLSKAAQSAYNPEAATGRQDIYGQRQSMSQAGYASAAPFPAGNVPNPYAVRPIPHAGSPHFDTTQRIPLGQADGDVAAPGTGGGTTTAPAGPATGIPKMSPAELMKRGAVPANSNVPDPKSNPLTTQPQAVPNRAPGTNTPLAPASNSPSSAAQNVAQASANNQFNPKASYANGQLYAENGAMSMQDPLPQGPYNYWAKPSAANNKPGFVNDAYYKNHPFYSKFPAPAGPTGVSSDLPPSADAPAEAPAANPSGPKPPRLGKIAGQPDKRPAGVPAPPPPPPAPKAKHPIQAPSDDASSSSAASAASSSSSSSAASSDASDAEASSNGEPTASSVLGSDSGASLEEPASADLAHHEDSGAESASASSGDITGSGSA